MQHNAIAARTWDRESVSLFCLLGLAASAVVLLTSSAQTIAAITAALS